MPAYSSLDAWALRPQHTEMNMYSTFIWLLWEGRPRKALEAAMHSVNAGAEDNDNLLWLKKIEEN